MFDNLRKVINRYLTEQLSKTEPVIQEYVLDNFDVVLSGLMLMNKDFMNIKQNVNIKNSLVVPDT